MANVSEGNATEEESEDTFTAANEMDISQASHSGTNFPTGTLNQSEVSHVDQVEEDVQAAANPCQVLFRGTVDMSQNAIQVSVIIQQNPPDNDVRK
jgi:hypothetical protein